MTTTPAPTIPIWRQIRWRLSASFVLLAVLPSLLVGFWISTLALQDSQQHVIEQLESVADLKLRQIESWLSSSTAMLKLIGGGPIGGEIAALGATGSPDAEAATRVGALLAQAIQQTGTVDNGQPRFRSLFVYLPDGHIVAASEPNLIGRVVTRQPYFAASLSGDTLQQPYYAIGTTELIMAMTTPIKDATGATTAVLASDINLTTLGTIMLERSGLGHSGETYLVSKESNYLLTPSRFEGYPQTRAYRSEGIDRALSGEAGQGIYLGYRTPSTEVVGVYRWVPSLQAALLAEADRDEVLAEAGPLRRLSLGLTIGASLIALVLGLFVAARISRPLSNLTRVSEQIAHGNLSQRATVQTHDEIGALGIGFNHMADRLQGVLADLELRIAERTAELRGALTDREHSLTELRESINAQNELRETVRRMSSPVLPVLDGVLVMPLVGIIDQDRADQLTSELLLAIEHQHAHTIILDVTGVPLVDTHVAAALIQATDAARLLGAVSILVGIRPELAQTIVGLGVDLSSIQSLADLQSGIFFASRRSLTVI
jgi:anti-anti-sigma regulatory factor/HAMP domain-containing protein